MEKRLSYAMAFLLPHFFHVSTIPNLLHAFSVHLMNCYFHDFWYSHVTEKRTSEERNIKAILRLERSGIWIPFELKLNVPNETSESFTGLFDRVS